MEMVISLLTSKEEWALQRLNGLLITILKTKASLSLLCLQASRIIAEGPADHASDPPPPQLPGPSIQPLS